jgi:molecular chaperone GrpE
MADQEQQAQQQTEQAQDAATQETAQARETPIEQVRQLKIRIEALEKELASEREKATGYMNTAMRAQAEISNTRKRLQQDLSNMMRDALKEIVYAQLAVLDSFDRAFAALPKEFQHFTWVEGMGLIQMQLFGILQRAGVTPIEAVGRPYNPIEHEPVAIEETSDYPEDTVTSELQRGYKLLDQVLRPALVKIARAPQPVAAGDAAENGNTDATTENPTAQTESI